MVLAIPIYVLYAFHIISAISLALVFCTNCFFLSKSSHWAIKTGISPENGVRIYNNNFFINLTSLCFLVLSILMAIIEVCLLLKVKFAENFRVGFQRPVLYIVTGMVTLGICGDLGIAAGSLTIISGGLWLILTIAAMV